MQGFNFERGPTIFKVLKNTICLGLCKLKCTEKRFNPFSPLHFLPEFVPHTEFKGRPEDTKWNVLYHTALRNYAAISLQVPSILSILLGCSSPMMIHSKEKIRKNPSFRRKSISASLIVQQCNCKWRCESMFLRLGLSNPSLSS